jgi:hypothetical protein
MDFESAAGDCEIQAAYAAQVQRDFELARDNYQVHGLAPRKAPHASWRSRRDRTWRAGRIASCARPLEVRLLVSCCHRKRAARVQLAPAPHLQN